MACRLPGISFILRVRVKAKTTKDEDRKPGGNEGIRYSKVTDMKHGFRRKLHIGFRNLKKTRGLRPEKTGSQRAKHETHSRKGLKQE